MKGQAKAAFALKSWDEHTWEGQPAAEVKGAKLTRAEVGVTIAGDLEGTSRIQYLMTYTPDGAASFVGLEHFTGKLAGRAGTCVLQHTGTFDGRGVRSSGFVVPGSGTGELASLRGETHSEMAGQQESYPFTWDYELE